MDIIGTRETKEKLNMNLKAARVRGAINKGLQNYLNKQEQVRIARYNAGFTADPVNIEESKRDYEARFAQRKKNTEVQAMANANLRNSRAEGDRLISEGRKLVNDTKSVLDNAKKVLQELVNKNLRGIPGSENLKIHLGDLDRLLPHTMGTIAAYEKDRFPKDMSAMESEKNDIREYTQYIENDMRKVREGISKARPAFGGRKTRKYRNKRKTRKNYM